MCVLIYERNPKGALISFDCAQWFSRLILFYLSMDFLRSTGFMLSLKIAQLQCTLIKWIFTKHNSSCLMPLASWSKSHNSLWKLLDEKRARKWWPEWRGKSNQDQQKERRNGKSNANHRSRSRKSFIIFSTCELIEPYVARGVFVVRPMLPWVWESWELL